MQNLEILHSAIADSKVSDFGNIMHRLLLSLLILGLLSGCISIETRTPPPPVFVTAILPAGPTATATPTATPEGVLPRPEDCTDEAVLLEDVTIPDGTIVKSGESFVKTWRLKNVGTCPWDANYRLVFMAGERMSAPDSVALTVTLPGESADVSVALIAPSANGSYVGIFILRNPLGQTVMIGTSDNVWVKIVVGK